MLTTKGKIYLIHMKTREYYKLPGGGIDEGESDTAALHRELLEECGTDGKILGEIGIVEEFRDDVGLHQHSYCYLMQQEGSHGRAAYEASEVADGAELYIADSIKDAIQLVEGSVPKDDECRFMQRRDSLLLKEAARLLGV
jgi:ADP-ribose pyrophosphatase YjhB (NUDIX family)